MMKNTCKNTYTNTNINTRSSWKMLGIECHLFLDESHNLTKCSSRHELTYERLYCDVLNEMREQMSIISSKKKWQICLFNCDSHRVCRVRIGSLGTGPTRYIELSSHSANQVYRFNPSWIHEWMNVRVGIGNLKYIRRENSLLDVKKKMKFFPFDYSSLFSMEALLNSSY